MAIIHQTIQVPHLGGITAGYALSNGGKYDSSKPTVVFINSMNTTVDLYQKQFESSALTEAANLLAIEPLGHGATSCPSDQFTYWDTATMALQVIEKLGIDKVFAVGTSQGGWMVVRMALLAPEKVVGLLPLGTSMDCESADSRSKGCWDPKTLLMPKYEQWCSPVPTPDFVVDDEWCGMVGSLGFGSGVSAETIQFWHGVLKRVYRGDEGRRKLRMALACLIERDGLLLRLRDIKCPVYWLQGTEDVVYGKTVPQEHIAMFTSSKETKLEFLEGGGHYLNATNPAEVEKFILEMVNKYK